MAILIFTEILLELSLVIAISAPLKKSISTAFTATPPLNVLSNALAFQNGAKKALQYPLLLKTLLKLRLVPLALLKQISAGLFSHYFIQKNYLGYYKLEITKK